MEILIYRNDEHEKTASSFANLREAIDYMKVRAEQESRPLTDYIIKPKDDSQ